MSFFHIIFNFITSIKQIIILKKVLNQMDTVATKRKVTDVTKPVSDTDI